MEAGERPARLGGGGLMNRLRDESGLDPISEKGIGILRAVRPTSSVPGLKRKVWASLQQMSISSPVRPRLSSLRVVVVGVGLMVFTATAAATIGGRKLAARIERLSVSYTHLRAHETGRK